MVLSERHERVRPPHRRRASDGRRATVALRRRSPLASVWALVVMAPAAFARGAYLDPPRADPGLGGFAAQVAFGAADGDVAPP